MRLTTNTTVVKARSLSNVTKWRLNQQFGKFALSTTAKVTFRSSGSIVVVDLISDDAKDYVFECTGMRYTTMVLDKSSDLLIMLKLKFEGVMND